MTTAKKAADMRDANNLEIRSVQNVLERYLLKSDSSFYCTTIHTAKFGACDETNIPIFPVKMERWQITQALFNDLNRIPEILKRDSP